MPRLPTNSRLAADLARLRRSLEECEAVRPLHLSQHEWVALIGSLNQRISTLERDLTLEPADPRLGVQELSDLLRQVVSLIAEGQTSKGIAQSLEMSPRMVDWHITECLENFGAKNRSEMIAKALATGAIRRG